MFEDQELARESTRLPSGARAEILFLERDTPGVAPVETAARLRQEHHVAFPGGKAEEGDEDGKYTGACFPRSFLHLAGRLTLHAAMRHTWEEIGLDLQERDYLCVGHLDDREITTSLGKRLLMILSPFGASIRNLLKALPGSPARTPIPANGPCALVTTPA